AAAPARSLPLDPPPRPRSAVPRGRSDHHAHSTQELTVPHPAGTAGRPGNPPPPPRPAAGRTVRSPAAASATGNSAGSTRRCWSPRPQNGHQTGDHGFPSHGRTSRSHTPDHLAYKADQVLAVIGHGDHPPARLVWAGVTGTRGGRRVPVTSPKAGRCAG